MRRGKKKKRERENGHETDAITKMIVIRATATRLSRRHGGNPRVSITELEDASRGKLSCPRYVQTLGRKAEEPRDGWSMKLWLELAV